MGPSPTRQVGASPDPGRSDPCHRAFASIEEGCCVAGRGETCNSHSMIFAHAKILFRSREMGKAELSIGWSKSPNAGSRRGPGRPTAGVLAAREHTRGAVLCCGHDGNGRRSGASFGARAGEAARHDGHAYHGQTPLAPVAEE